MLGPLLAILCAFGGSAAALGAAAREVTVVYAPDAGTIAPVAARHLADRLEAPPAVRTATTVELPDLLAAARGAWSTAFVVVLAPERGQVTVIRAEDGTALSRFLDRRAFAESPYALAVAAAELLELARRPRGDPSAPEMQAVLLAGWSFLASAGVALGSGPGDEPVLFQPSLVAALLYRGSGHAWWTSIGMGARFLGAADAALGDGEDALTTSYRTEELELTAAIGLSSGDLDVGLTTGIGGSYTRVSVRRPGGEPIAEDQRLVAWVPFGSELRYALGRGFWLGFSAEVGFVPRPARYLVAGRVSLEEGGVRGTASLSLVWASGGR
ncbi:MAG: hypothetical protein IT384_01915 [Deltaproteobacteria bacterium]|nr:hypothetical protein [Deltaproteobacteria bacterium]